MSSSSSATVVRSMTEADLGDADRIMRLAFGTFLGMPNPSAFMGDASYVANRWRADSRAAFSACVDGSLVGSNFATTWGSFGFFGPLTVHPDMWNRGVAKPLIAAAVERFEERTVSTCGLYTFANSQKHVALYQKFGFWPRYLIALVSCPVATTAEVSYTILSQLSNDDRDSALRSIAALTNSIHDGLDVRSEIHAVHSQSLGDTVLVYDDSSLAGFAVCHDGPGTEAGTGTCYMKFAAVRSGQSGVKDFDHLLRACNAHAATQRATKLTGGVNTAREFAYQQMLNSGFTIDRLGVSMVRPSHGGYDRRDTFVVDDWR